MSNSDGTQYLNEEAKSSESFTVFYSQRYVPIVCTFDIHNVQLEGTNMILEGT